MAHILGCSSAAIFRPSPYTRVLAWHRRSEAAALLKSMKGQPLRWSAWKRERPGPAGTGSSLRATALWLRFILTAETVDVRTTDPCSACVLGGAPVLTWCPHQSGRAKHRCVLSPASARPGGHPQVEGAV